MTSRSLDGLAYTAMVIAVVGLAATLLSSTSIGLPLMAIAGTAAIIVIACSVTPEGGQQ